MQILHVALKKKNETLTWWRRSEMGGRRRRPVVEMRRSRRQWRSVVVGVVMRRRRRPVVMGRMGGSVVRMHDEVQLRRSVQLLLAVARLDGYHVGQVRLDVIYRLRLEPGGEDVGWGGARRGRRRWEGVVVVRFLRFGAFLYYLHLERLVLSGDVCLSLI